MTLTPYNVPVCSGTQKEQHQDSFSTMVVFLFKSCYTKRYCACLISMCFHGMLHHTCITCHNIHHNIILKVIVCFLGQESMTKYAFFCSLHPILIINKKLYPAFSRKANGLTLNIPVLKGPKCKFQILFFGGVAGSENFAYATLSSTPLDFQSKIKNFCHPTVLKIRFKITVTPPPP